MEAEERISEMEDRTVERNETERKKELKEMRTTSKTSNVQCPNIRIIGVPEEDKKKSHEKLLEKVIVENFPKMGKEIATHVQETQRVPNRTNPSRNTPKHILIKLMKNKHKQRILKPYVFQKKTKEGK